MSFMPGLFAPKKTKVEKVLQLEVKSLSRQIVNYINAGEIGLALMKYEQETLSMELEHRNAVIDECQEIFLKNNKKNFIGE